MYGLRNSELSTCLFQFSHKTRQTMLLYAYFIPKVDFKRKFNHHQSFLYEWLLTAQTIRKFRIWPSIRIESRIGRTIRNRIELWSFAGPYSATSQLRSTSHWLHTEMMYLQRWSWFPETTRPSHADKMSTLLFHLESRDDPLRPDHCYFATW